MISNQILINNKRLNITIIREEISSSPLFDFGDSFTRFELSGCFHCLIKLLN
jgi:hypothetical protein